MSAPVDIQVRFDPVAQHPAGWVDVSEWVMRGGRYVTGTLRLKTSSAHPINWPAGTEICSATVVWTGDDTADLIKLGPADDAAFDAARTRFLRENYRDAELGWFEKRYGKFHGQVMLSGRDIDVTLPAAGDSPDHNALDLLKQFLALGPGGLENWHLAAGLAFHDFAIQSRKDECDPSPTDGEMREMVDWGSIEIEGVDIILHFHAHDVDGVIVRGPISGPRKSTII